MSLTRLQAVIVLMVGLAGCSASAGREPKSLPKTPSSPVATGSPPLAKMPTYALTGLPVTSSGRSGRPALSIKVDNITAALPQAGLNSADIVADILVEGGLTRLMATFQSQDAALVGPIRSARPVDADLLRELRGGIFAYSGADRREIAPVIQHSTSLLLSNDAHPGFFTRLRGRGAPHDVFSSTTRLYQAAEGLSSRPLPTPLPLFSYSTRVPGGQVAKSVSLTFSRVSSVGWSWNGEAYARSQNRRPDRLSSGDLISTTNVVILSVTFRSTSIIDAAGNADPYVIVIGSGKATVLRNGRVLTGRWLRTSTVRPMRLVDSAGRTIPLAPGRTWLELQPRPFKPVLRS